MNSEPRIGIALGGGAARGLAHIVVLEALDEMGLRPHHIAGCSIGALLGAAYASGLSGREIRAHASSVLGRPGKAMRQLLWPKGGGSGAKTVNISLFQPISLNGLGLVQQVSPPGMAARIEDTRIPLSVIATDFLSGAEVTLGSGRMESALAASIAIPGVISAPKLNGRVMIDGAYTDPVPVAPLRRHGCDIVIAVDVTGRPQAQPGNKERGPVEMTLGAMQIMQKRITALHFATTAPDLVISPGVDRFRAHEFLKIGDILRAAEPERERLKRLLEPLLAGR